jgi:hypothetical protein
LIDVEFKPTANRQPPTEHWPRPEVCSPQAPRLARRARRCRSGLGPGLECEASIPSLLPTAITCTFRGVWLPRTPRASCGSQLSPRFGARGPADERPGARRLGAHRVRLRGVPPPTHGAGSDARCKLAESGVR